MKHHEITRKGIIFTYDFYGDPLDRQPQDRYTTASPSLDRVADRVRKRVLDVSFRQAVLEG